jgi:hypothetical protein
MRMSLSEPRADELRQRSGREAAAFRVLRVADPRERIRGLAKTQLLDQRFGSSAPGV